MLLVLLLLADTAAAAFVTSTAAATAISTAAATAVAEIAVAAAGGVTAHKTETVQLIGSYCFVVIVVSLKVCFVVIDQVVRIVVDATFTHIQSKHVCDVTISIYQVPSLA